MPVKRVLLLAALALALPALPQFVPPVPKRVEGSLALTRRGPIPLPAENQSWIRVESPRFTIISSANEERTQRVAENLEVLASSLRQVNERFDGSTIRTQVLLFARRRDSQPLFDLLLNRDRAPSPGVFIEHSDGSGTMVIDAAREWNRTIFHELIHNLLSASGAEIPLWLEEGIAEYFSTAEFRGRAIILGRPIREHQRTIMRAQLRAADVIGAPRNSPAAAHSAFYPTAWGIVDWMMRANRRAFYPLLADVERGMPSADAIRKHYGVDAAIIERILRRPLTPAAVSRIELELTTGPAAVKPISNADALREIGTFLGRIEVAAPDAERFFLEAIALEPQNARAMAAFAAFRGRQREYEKAFALYERALAAAPDDPQVLLSFAEALMQTVIGTFAGTLPLAPDAPPRIRRARELAARALEHGSDPAPANAVIGASYVSEKDARPGIAPLEKALEMRPARHDIALNLYTLYLRSGDRRRADDLFARRFADSRDPQVSFAARSIFVQEQLRRVNDLIRRNELDEVQALMQELISVTPDPVAKANLETQLRGIRRTAEVNGHIRRYNEAVNLSTTDPKGALRIIEDLLAVAKDEDVVADAARLKEMLEWRIRAAARR
jgi:tetratricopeptide (TPR) repeat protein